MIDYLELLLDAQEQEEREEDQELEAHFFSVVSRRARTVKQEWTPAEEKTTSESGDILTEKETGTGAAQATDDRTEHDGQIKAWISSVQTARLEMDAADTPEAGEIEPVRAGMKVTEASGGDTIMAGIDEIEARGFLAVRDGRIGSETDIFETDMSDSTVNGSVGLSAAGTWTAGGQRVRPATAGTRTAEDQSVRPAVTGMRTAEDQSVGLATAGMQTTEDGSVGPDEAETWIAETGSTGLEMAGTQAVGDGIAGALAARRWQGEILSRAAGGTAGGAETSGASSLYQQMAQAGQAVSSLRQNTRVVTAIDSSSTAPSLGAVELDEIFSRDARRYDSGFSLF